MRKIKEKDHQDKPLPNLPSLMLGGLSQGQPHQREKVSYRRHRRTYRKQRPSYKKLEKWIKKGSFSKKQRRKI